MESHGGSVWPFQTTDSKLVHIGTQVLKSNHTAPKWYNCLFEQM